METDLLRRYAGIAAGMALALVLLWWTGRTRVGDTLGLPHRTTPQLLWISLAMLTGFAIFVVLVTLAGSIPWLLAAFAVIGMGIVIVMAGVQARRRPDLPLPRTDLLLRWMIPITLALLAVGFGVRAVLGPGIPLALVAGLGLGLLPGVAFLTLFTLAIRLARSPHN